MVATGDIAGKTAMELLTVNGIIAIADTTDDAPDRQVFSEESFNRVFVPVDSS
jgi:hypothetical protein